MRHSQILFIDAKGNTLSDAQGRSYTWDFENRLTQVVVPGVGATTYRYDPFGRRIYKQAPSSTSIFIYDGVGLVERLDASGAEVASYTQRTRAIDETLAEMSSNSADYYEADGLGSITSLTNSATALTNTHTYDSFGNTTNSTGTPRNPFQYTGREFDPETNLYYYRARYYDQSMGRFVSGDPIGFRGGINFYRYVRNNPILFKDPTGQACYSGWEKAGLILSCLAGLDADNLSPPEGPQDSTDSPEPVNGQHSLGPRNRPFNPRGADSQTPDNAAGGAAYAASVADCISRVSKLPSCQSKPCPASMSGYPEHEHLMSGW